MELLENLLWLCRIPSPTGEERNLADELAQRLAALPSASPPRRYGDSLVAPLTRGSGGPKILLVGQLDVATAGQRGEARTENKRVLGAGAAEKSGLCLMLDLAERRPQVHADITLVFHARGACGFDASELRVVMKQDAELREADFALVLRPTDNKLQLGSGGSTHATLAFAGRTGHSGLPGAGVNAIHKFARVLSQLAAFEPVPDVVDGLTWYEMMNATSAHGGRSGSVVPDHLEVNVHHTYGPSTSSHTSQERLMALVDRVGAVRFEELSRPAPPNRNHALIAALEQSGVQGVEARQTWSEVASFTTLGIPAANFGPGAERTMHALNEVTELSELARAQTILDQWFAKMA
ncbi:peptidase dimerization domain-containing protein [Sorangium sp. So ce295]|uniref:peptidase dimerization domain-containing protein n=1 Tax=Sorangium sp. So ce295 TaxID=3133295 RepID=UPI003F646542